MNALIGDGYLKSLYKKGIINEYVKVTATRPFGYPKYDQDFLENLLNWDCQDNYRYFSDPLDNPYIQFQFKNRIPSFYGYSFETHRPGDDGSYADVSHPTKWDVKGSDSASGPWTLLDERETTILTGFWRKANFTMKGKQFQFIKFTQYSNF